MFPTTDNLSTISLPGALSVCSDLHYQFIYRVKDECAQRHNHDYADTNLWGSAHFSTGLSLPTTPITQTGPSVQCMHLHAQNFTIWYKNCCASIIFCLLLLPCVEPDELSSTWNDLQCKCAQSTHTHSLFCRDWLSIDSSEHSCTSCNQQRGSFSQPAMGSSLVLTTLLTTIWWALLKKQSRLIEQFDDRVVVLIK